MTRFTWIFALLTGCTLLTDPSSFEGGEAPDMRVDMTTPDMGGEDLPAPELVDLGVVPEVVEIAIGTTETVRVIGFFSDGSQEDVTSLVDLSVPNDSVVTLAGAELTGAAPGRGLLRSTLGAVSLDTPVEVNLGGLPVFTDGLEDGFVRAFFAGSAEFLEPAADSFLGESALRVGVPEEGFTGFTILAGEGQDLSRFNAMTAWVRGAEDGVEQVLDVIGFGIDLEANPRLVETDVGIPLTSEWQLIAIPLPDPTRYLEERGVFHVAEGGNGRSTAFLIDEIRFVELPPNSVEARAASFPTGIFPVPRGVTLPLPPGSLAMRVLDDELRLQVGAGLFETQSSRPVVVSIPADGLVEGLRLGESEVTGFLAGEEAEGSLTVVVIEPGAPPSIPAPRPPARSPTSVIGIYTDAYEEADVDTLAADFSEFGGSEEVSLSATDTALRYEEVGFIAIETARRPINAERMSHVHFDIWIEDRVATGLSFKLVDFGANGVFDGPGVADDSEAEFRYDNSGTLSPPRLSSGRWIAFDIPLAEFERGGSFDVGPGLDEREHLAQYIFGNGPSAGPVTFWLDNFYFYRDPTLP